MAAREGTETLGNAYGAPRTPADDAHFAQLARRAYRALPQNMTQAARLAALVNETASGTSHSHRRNAHAVDAPRAARRLKLPKKVAPTTSATSPL